MEVNFWKLPDASLKVKPGHGIRLLSTVERPKADQPNGGQIRLYVNGVYI